MNKKNCTKGPVTASPFLTPYEDNDPMMVYEVEGGDLQERFDSLKCSDEYIDENDRMVGGEYDEAEVAAIHAENQANAELIAEAFNVLHETGYTPRELADVLAYLSGKLGSLCDAMPDAENGVDTDDALASCRHIIDDMQAKLEEYQPVTPA